MWLKLLSFICIGLAILIGYFLYVPNIDPIDFDNIVYKMGGPHKAFVLGGSGGIGKSIVKALAKSPEYEKVTLIGRRVLELPISDAESNYDKFDQKVMDFDKISDQSHLFKGCDVGFYVVGVSSSTVTEAEYKRIELDNALAIAKGIQEAGDCKNLHWVTSQTIGKNSLFLAGRVKAQVEEETSKMGFPRLAFYRPAKVLFADKSGMMGSVIKALDFGNRLTVESELMGRVMVANALREADKPVEVFETVDINKFGKTLLA